MCKHVAYDLTQKLSLYTVTKVSYSTVCGRDCNAVVAVQTRTLKVSATNSKIWTYISSLRESRNLSTRRFTC